ncbi:replication initiation factor domain-containing protein [Paenibacillus allorhizosphaerae]|uniref:Uncharacterized protein n=1 Tax=Paenibacillus allorhizosphaerae TaxID=2849866 RepID=A0ABN7TRF8_9BACL|nr:replication initiation factor domain-containing protein [Paenibacillus allorhizosphaerae]CAG7648120.1 hypothetical protein PAECIP111802_04129 [Paenibacillus allorhizosphaerae]
MNQNDLNLNELTNRFSIKNVSIDRLYLAVDSMGIASRLQRMFPFNQSSRYYRSKFSNNGFTIYVDPIVRNIPKVKLIINTKRHRNELTEPIKEVLALTKDWIISALDIAYDFNVKMSNTFVLARANAIKNTYDRNVYWFSRRNDSRSLLYDKKKQLEEKGKKVNDNNWIRYEIRLCPKSKMPLVNMDFSYLESLIDKHIFVPSYSKLESLSTNDKEILRDVKRRKNYDFIGLGTAYQITNIKKTLRSNGVPFYQIFDLMKDQMFKHIIEAIRVDYH